jgi:hypothetical protein
MNRIFTFILLTILSFNVAYSQQDNTLFFMHELPQANFVNPAVPSTCKLFIGMPALSSIAANYSNTAFTIRDGLTTREGSDSLYFDPDKIISKARGKELITSDIDLTLFTMGMHVKKYYLTFSINEKARTYNMIQADAMKMAWYGNTRFRGDQASVKGTRVNGNNYHEFAFGASRDLNSSWRFGARFNILFGLANVYSVNTKGYLYTDKNTFAMNLLLDSRVKTSLPIDSISIDSIGNVSGIYFKDDMSVKDYLLNFRNFGFGIDLGFIHNLDEKTVLSGSLLDLGTIFWKKDINQFYTDGAMAYSGLGSEGGFDSFDQLTDSLAVVYTPRLDSAVFSSPLVPKLYVGVTRRVHDHINVGALVRTELYRNRLHPSLTISANTRNFNVFNASVSYTVQNGEFTNIGAGIGVKAGPVHLHLISDNIPGLFMLDNTRNVNIRFGLSFVPGCNERVEPESSANKHGAIPCNFSYTPAYKALPPKNKKNKKRRKL